jgi:uncharacterized membrane protein
MGRLASLDVLRGGIIVLMALDHARGFIARNHPAEFWGGNLPNYEGDWVAFLTRLVTHLCAPGFMFLMGAGAALFAESRRRDGWSPRRVALHLVLRGLVLIALGQAFENTAAAFGTGGTVRPETYGLRVPGAPGPVTVVLGVLYGLGGSLAVAALLLRLPPAALVAIACGCVAATHWLTPPAESAGAPIPALLGLLVVAGVASPIVDVYPVVPWLAPTLLGVAFGTAVALDRVRPFVLLGRAGAAFLVVFVVLRASGDAGSLNPVQPGWIGFLNVTKYPPALTFLLLTLGADFVLLSVIERRGVAAGRWLEPLRVFGAVPLFFFITHLWLYAAIGRLLVPTGTTVPRMYAWWLLGLVILYLPCRWYRDFRLRRPPASIFRLL